jgi:GTP-binding protein EngB required for normal cell division
MQQQAYDFLVPALVTLALLVVTTILVLLWRKTTARKNTVLFVGLSDAGKTSIFTKLINSGKF